MANETTMSNRIVFAKTPGPGKPDASARPAGTRTDDVRYERKKKRKYRPKQYELLIILTLYHVRVN